MFPTPAWSRPSISWKGPPRPSCPVSAGKSYPALVVTHCVISLLYTSYQYFLNFKCFVDPFLILISFQLGPTAWSLLEIYHEKNLKTEIASRLESRLETLVSVVDDHYCWFLVLGSGDQTLAVPSSSLWLPDSLSSIWAIICSCWRSVVG